MRAFYSHSFIHSSIHSAIQSNQWGGAAARQGSSDEGTYTFSYVSLVLAILFGAFGGCVLYLHDAIVDAVFISKDDTSITSTIKTLEQTNHRSSSPKRGARGGDDATAVETTATESTAPIKNTQTNKQNAEPSLGEDSDGSYELV